MGISEKKFFTIDQGESKSIEVYLIDKDSDEVVDITEATEITARFVKDDSSLLEKALSEDEIEVLSIAGGKIKIILTEEDTAALKVDEKQTFEVECVVDSVTTIIKFERALTVKAAIA